MILSWVVKQPLMKAFKVAESQYCLDVDILKSEKHIYNELVHDIALSRSAQAAHHIISNSLNSVLPHFYKVVQILSGVRWPLW